MNPYERYNRRFGQPYYTGNDYVTLGESIKRDSDLIMEDTWWHDPQSKVAYIYDYFHDDSPDLCYGMTYENTTKTKVDVKFIITEHGSFSKDQPTAKIMFRPSMKVHFNEGDDLYYLEERMKRYGATDVFVGTYIDLPDEKGVYHRWMICLSDIQGNQFQKYFVLPCNYKLQWISKVENKRVKNNMWCVLRTQSSYNNGLWTDRETTTRENQEILFIPTNSISDTIWYRSEDDVNQRLIVDVPCENPNVWQVSKVEKVNVKLRTKITLYQHEFDPHTDYIEKDENGTIIGMYADYFVNEIEPVTRDELQQNDITYQCILTASNNNLKVGGSYKLITAKIYDDNGNDITNNYSYLTTDHWKFYIDDVDITGTNLVTVLSQSECNKIKIKFADDKSYLSKLLTVKCYVDDVRIAGDIQFELISL